MGSLISKPVLQTVTSPAGQPQGKDPVLDEKASVYDSDQRTYRPHPQLTFAETTIEPGSFFGQLRGLYAATVLKTQLDQLRKQGSYDAYELKWKPVYDVRRTKGAKCQADGNPPSLFWPSDIAKWIEGACYFLASPDGRASPHAEEFEQSIDELVGMMENAQDKQGYLNPYFMIVDPEGKIMNLRDCHEMYNAGHLLEAALAHHALTGSNRFLNVMIKVSRGDRSVAAAEATADQQNIDYFAKRIGPGKDQLHGYPGHPEIELAVLRLADQTGEKRFTEFANYLVSERGKCREDLGGERYYTWEAKVRRKDIVVHWPIQDIRDLSYNLSHAPLHQQDTILGHSVRALYLLTAAADLGGLHLEDAKRLLYDAIEHKMYVTGGLGTEPQIEGFSETPYRLPQSTEEGGCYAETCASIACMMVCERLLSYEYDIKARDAMELCLYNAALGGVSLNGTKFAYANKLATSGDETAFRHDWFEVCCCPPNMSRTLGIIGGYMWRSTVRPSNTSIDLDVYLFASAERSIQLPCGGVATVKMESEMPWKGGVKWHFDAPPGWWWRVRVPKPAYARNPHLTLPGNRAAAQVFSGCYAFGVDGRKSITLDFDMPVTLVAPHPRTHQNTLNVMRGPIVYVAESVDNAVLDRMFKHFEGVGISPSAEFEEVPMTVEGFEVVGLRTKEPVKVLARQKDCELYRAVPASECRWKDVKEKLVFVPWFARANRGGAGRLRTAMLRAD